MTLLTYLNAVAALVLLVPALVFATEVTAGCLFKIKKPESSTERRLRVAVLIPAHNESVGVIPTISDLKQQLRPGDRVVVIADNCTDDTAAVATKAGAEVTGRNDLNNLGKGYALAWGVNYLTVDAPEIVIVIDADCRLAPDAIDCLAAACSQSQRPVQSLYLMTAPVGSRINHQVAEFAWRVKNWARPLGLSLLGLPCQLMGTGMAFPWHVIRSADLSNGFIVEDLKLGLDLAEVGQAPIFWPAAMVTSTFPTSAQGTKTQRRRWEQGHIGLILIKAPALLFSSVRRWNRDLLALTMDLIVPPITLLVLLLTTMVFVTAIAAIAGTALYPLIISLVSFALVIAATVVAWFKFGRDLLPPGSFVLIARYGMEKLNVYAGVLRGLRNSRWVRTDRS